MYVQTTDLFIYALHKDNIVQHPSISQCTSIRKVDYIHRHDYVCPNCKEPLVAKCIKDGVRYEKTPHFSHIGTTCGKSGINYQSYIMAIADAQRLIENIGKITPHHVWFGVEIFPTTLAIKQIVQRPKLVIDGSNVSPDLQVVTANGSIYVEVNQTDAEKRTIYGNNQVPVIRVTEGKLKPYHQDLTQVTMESLFGKVVIPEPPAPVEPPLMLVGILRGINQVNAQYYAANEQHKCLDPVKLNELHELLLVANCPYILKSLRTKISKGHESGIGIAGLTGFALWVESEYKKKAGLAVHWR